MDLVTAYAYEVRIALTFNTSFYLEYGRRLDSREMSSCGRLSATVFVYWIGIPITDNLAIGYYDSVSVK